MVAGGPPGMLERWIAYSGLEPFGQARGDFQAGMICAELRNIFKNHQGELGDAKPGDFMVDFDAAAGPAPPGEETGDEALTPEEAQMILFTWAAAHNAHLERTP